MKLSKNKMVAGVVGLIALVSVVNTQAIIKITNTFGSQNQFAQVSRFDNNATYKRGDKGEVIRQIQDLLTKQGFYKGDISGTFGPQTERSVYDFQLKNGLKANGVLDKQTIDSIRSGRLVGANQLTTASGGPCPSGVIIGYDSNGVPICGSQIGAGGISQSCPQQGPLLISSVPNSQPTQISSISNAINPNQVIARFWLYPICDLVIHDINLVNNGSPSVVGSTPMTQTDLVFDNYKIYNGNVSASNLIGQTPSLDVGMVVNLNNPISLYANQPKLITIAVDVKPGATGTAQTCLVGFNTTQSNPSPLYNEWNPQLNNPQNSFGRLMGHLICQNKVSIISQ